MQNHGMYRMAPMCTSRHCTRTYRSFIAQQPNNLAVAVAGNHASFSPSRIPVLVELTSLWFSCFNPLRLSKPLLYGPPRVSALRVGCAKQSNAENKRALEQRNVFQLAPRANRVHGKQGLLDEVTVLFRANQILSN